MSDRSATLQEAINLAVQYGMRRLYTCIPAKVVKYDAAKQKVDCQVLIKEPHEDEEGNRQVESVPIISSVPVQFPGAGGYRMTFPISDGGGGSSATTGTLFFAHRSMDVWLSGNGQEVDPELDHDHALTDAVFMPGLNPFGAALQSCPTDHATIGADGGVQVHLRSDTICIGDEDTAQFVALADKVKAELDKIATTLGTGTTPVGGGTVTFGTPYTSAAVAASQAKAK